MNTMSDLPAYPDITFYSEVLGGRSSSRTSCLPTLPSSFPTHPTQLMWTQEGGLFGLWNWGQGGSSNNPPHTAAGSTPLFTPPPNLGGFTSNNRPLWNWGQNFVAGGSSNNPPLWNWGAGGSSNNPPLTAGGSTTTNNPLPPPNLPAVGFTSINPPLTAAAATTTTTTNPLLLTYVEGPNNKPPPGNNPPPPGKSDPSYQVILRLKAAKAAYNQAEGVLIKYSKVTAKIDEDVDIVSEVSESKPDWRFVVITKKRKVARYAMATGIPVELVVSGSQNRLENIIQEMEAAVNPGEGEGEGEGEGGGGLS